MLKKLFIIIIGTGTIFSSNNDSAKLRPKTASEEIEQAILSIAQSHLKIDGRKIKSFYSPPTLKVCSDKREFFMKRFCRDKDSELRLCKLEERPMEKHGYKKQPNLFGSSLYQFNAALENFYSECIPSWDDIAIDPIYSQSKTVASSMKQAVKILTEMLCLANTSLDEQLVGTYIEAPFIHYSPVIKLDKLRNAPIDIITAKFDKYSWYMSLVCHIKLLIIDDALNNEDLQRLSKSELFAAQVYTELLKNRPKEVDGIKIMYTSEQQ